MKKRLIHNCVVSALAVGVLIAGQNKSCADGPSATPQVYDGHLNMVFFDGVPSGTVAKVTAGGVTKNIKVESAATTVGMSVVELPFDEAGLERSLEAGQPVDITVAGPGLKGHWQIVSVINYVKPAPQDLPRSGNGTDTTSTGTLEASSRGGYAHLKFTAEKNNYVPFDSVGLLPDDAIAVGGIVHADSASPMTALLGLRVKDARGEIFGYNVNGRDHDIASMRSAPLTQFRYRFAGPPVSPEQKVTPKPTNPSTVIGVLLEPTKWQWAGSMSTYVSCIYAIRELEYTGAPVPAKI